MVKSDAIQIEIDPSVDAVYIRLSGCRIASTRELDTDVMVDIDAKGKPVGIEFLDSARIVAGLRKFQNRFHHPSLRRLRPSALQRLIAGKCSA